MDVNQAIEIAQDYVRQLFGNDQITSLDLEETERDRAKGEWRITLTFSRPWHTPRTRTQEVLEQLGASPAGRRSYKVLTISDDGEVISMKNRQRAEAVD